MTDHESPDRPREPGDALAEPAVPSAPAGLRARLLAAARNNHFICAGGSTRPLEECSGEDCQEFVAIAAALDGQGDAAALPDDYLTYALRNMSAAVAKREDAPASSAAHERSALLALQSERIPSLQEWNQSWAAGDAAPRVASSQWDHDQKVRAKVLRRCAEEIENAQRNRVVLLEELIAWYRAQADNMDPSATSGSTQEKEQEKTLGLPEAPPRDDQEPPNGD